MKGIILAGGAGSRLYPLTLVASKQLQPVYDKPMIYYPLTTMIEAGIREFCIISTPHDLPRFKQLFGDGSRFGISIEYREQLAPEGLPQAFTIADTFIGKESVAMILGDNIFYGAAEVFRKAFSEYNGKGGIVFGYEVNDPRRYGVIELDSAGKPISLEEKPSAPRSNYAIPGLYVFDNDVIEIARNLKKSGRNEYEIVDVIRTYMNRGDLKVHILPEESDWFDAGTSSSLQETADFIKAAQKRKGRGIGCPEIASLNHGFLNISDLQQIVNGLKDCEYKEYLQKAASRKVE